MDNKLFTMEEILNAMEEKLPSVPLNMYDALHNQYKEEAQQQREEIYREKNKELRGWKTACIAMIITWVLLLIGVGYIFMNYDFITFNQDVETGNANFIGDENRGDISYGETKDSVLPTKDE